MSSIYLAYRKSDAHPEVARVVEGLMRAHGAATFVNGVAMTASPDAFRTMVETAMRETVGTVIIIGPDFNTAPDALGRRRLDDPNDPLRVEIESALKIHGMMVVVATVDLQFIPDASELPRSLRPITRRGAIPLPSAEYFEYIDAGRSYLNRAVRQMLSGSAKRAMRLMIAIFLVLTITAAIVVIFGSIAANTPR